MPRILQSLLVLCLLVLLAVRFWGIANPPLDRESWRQADTESMAHRVATSPPGWQWLQPQLYYEGPAPNVVQLEPPFYPTVTGLAYRVFGEHYWIARGLSILLFALSAWCLYRLARRFLHPLAGLLAVCLYAAYPVNLYYSRAIMPEALLVCFSTSALLLFDRWTENGRRRDFWLAVLLTAGGIVTKPQAAIIGLPMIGLLVGRHGWKVFGRPTTWLFGALALLPPFAYYWLLGHSGSAEQTFVDGILAHHISEKVGAVLLQAQTWTDLKALLYTAFTREAVIWAALAGLAALLTSLFRKHRSTQLTMLLCWVAGATVHLVVIVSVIQFDYYLMIITAPAALASAWLVHRLMGLSQDPAPKGPPVRAGLVGLLALGMVGAIAYRSWRTVRPWFTVDQTKAAQVTAIRQVTQPDDLLLVGSFSPELLSASGRYGWRLHIHTQTRLIRYPDMPEAIEQEIEYFRRLGARFFVPLRGTVWVEQERVLRYLDEHYERIELGENDLYDLRQPKP